ncbi:hypothetical protein TRFO_21929 [Tritrichomonas foetus]|uniref:Initiator binding domain-containing protein n=1 Tax=Tritrichomonas foetus TaxID=1144522 RepID=A0A1J4KDJ6_9EUKA|nr:hypothetical protein TRFO_21929 [Tritrichomonas foetus]|eukprot:OHT09267.1 hypothetical protein TRFO_21929 [Tritrichomonas foetus]
MIRENLMQSSLQPYWNALNDADRMGYIYLRSTISQKSSQPQRNRRIGHFSETLEIIRQFVMRNDGEESKRGICCGIYWIKDGIATNTHHLRLLFNKCKSSINGSFQKVGYTVFEDRAETGSTLSSVFPELKNKLNDLRKWTIRKYNWYSQHHHYKQIYLSPISPILVKSEEGNTIKKPFEISLDVIIKTPTRSIVNTSINTELLEFDPFLIDSDASYWSF